MGTYVWVLIGLQVIAFWQLFRLKRIVTANIEIVRMLIEIVALQKQLNDVQNDLQNVQNIETEFNRIIGNL